jgi:hypothetical protein
MWLFQLLIVFGALFDVVKAGICDRCGTQYNAAWCVANNKGAGRAHCIRTACTAAGIQVDAVDCTCAQGLHGVGGHNTPIQPPSCPMDDCCLGRRGYGDEVNVAATAFNAALNTLSQSVRGGGGLRAT